ncbi:hypothetical protein BKA82DRAFT_4452113 [Pisolithus tinctorius]|nr:hypothetical protein BKA82DRAFT_4452113 [Pisolithus tinctorius]
MHSAHSLHFGLRTRYTLVYALTTHSPRTRIERWLRKACYYSPALMRIWMSGVGHKLTTCFVVNSLAYLKFLIPSQRCSMDKSEIIFSKMLETWCVTHNEIPFKLIIQWVKKQHPKGKGKHKAETDLGAEDSKSQLWTKSDSGDDADDPILSPISHGIKRCHIDVHDLDSEEAGPSHAGPSTSTTPDTIDLTNGPMDVTAPSDELPLLPAPPSTLPSTPIQTHTQLAPSSSFMIDTSLTNPWKGNCTFQF